ncbi:hypothetical protein [Acetobacter conturbans]|uniref:Uncharacterized protein n=1 Tax=Acetobacter conturbans TaxID=1737472 RepID=A0ABX0K4W2_9PROT|nr:hypothetical protein [Acetobacter conturbans]NHN89698.1 hypothetical protein [Acetobacter conturbans]
MMRIKFKNNVFILIGFALSGCAQIDPLYEASRWNSPSSNRRNLFLQVERPTDLTFGRYENDYDGSSAIDAVKRFRDGKVKNIEKTRITDVANSQSGGQGGQ